MIEKTLTIYILLRIKLRNGKMKIALAGSVKFTLTKEKKKLGKEKKAWNIQVIFLELWLLLTSIVLLPISSSFFFFYLFNCLFLAY